MTHWRELSKKEVEACRKEVEADIAAGKLTASGKVVGPGQVKSGKERSGLGNGKLSEGRSAKGKSAKGKSTAGSSKGKQKAKSKEFVDTDSNDPDDADYAADYDDASPDDANYDETGGAQRIKKRARRCRL
jgi:hypothetical protein